MSSPWSILILDFAAEMFDIYNHFYDNSRRKVYKKWQHSYLKYIYLWEDLKRILCVLYFYCWTTRFLKFPKIIC